MLNLFNKKKPQVINIYEEIHRIAKYMWEYEGRVEAISVNKILITERDYHAIWDGICQIIRNSIEKEGQNLPQMQQIQVIIRGQNLANRIIDKLYDIEWIY